jgi:hypothetical protein
VTHREMCQRAIRWLLNTKGCSVAFYEFASAAGEQPDAIGFHSGWSVVVECKTSRSDFHADKHKPWRRMPDLGMGHERYFLAPKGLLFPDEMPNGWGLLEANGRHVRVVRKSGGFPMRARNREIRFLVSMLRRAQIRIDQPLSDWLRMKPAGGAD